MISAGCPLLLTVVILASGKPSCLKRRFASTQYEFARPALSRPMLVHIMAGFVRCWRGLGCGIPPDSRA